MEEDELIELMNEDRKYEKILKKALKVEQEALENEDRNSIDWKYHEVEAHHSKLNKLMRLGAIKVTLDTSNHTYYQLKDREKIEDIIEKRKEIKEAMERSHEEIEEEEIPEDLFDAIVNYEEIKGLTMRSIEAEEPVHLLFEGEPATAKTLFMEEIARLPGAYFVETGGRVSEAGLAERIYKHRPRYLIIDEISDINKDAFSVLKPFMESGTLDETISGGKEKIQLDCNVYGTTNYPDKIPYEIRSRFLDLYFEEYTKEEFLEICKKYLPARENVNEDLAEYIGKKVWEDLEGDIRKARSICRLSTQKTKEDVDNCLRVLRKYRK